MEYDRIEMHWAGALRNARQLFVENNVLLQQDYTAEAIRYIAAFQLHH